MLREPDDREYADSYDDFEKLLNKFEDESYIKNWKNRSVDGGVNYEITFPKKQLAVEMKKDRSGKRLANRFKLIKMLSSDLLRLLDENHKLKNFQNKNEVVEDFVNLVLEDIKQIDVLGSWVQAEKYLDRELGHSTKVFLKDLEPFCLF